MSSPLQEALLFPSEPEETPLDRIHRDLRMVSVTVSAILDNLPVQRRPLSDSTRALHLRVTWERRNGFCPCCQQVAVCGAERKLEGSEFDHWYGRHRNGPEETWLVCGPCNRDLERPTFKGAARATFEAYQAALQLFLSGQGELFS